jgi:hypothetical protein
METDRPFTEPQDRQYAEDVSIHDVKFALTGIAIGIAVAILLMLVG